MWSRSGGSAGARARAVRTGRGSGRVIGAGLLVVVGLGGCSASPGAALSGSSSGNAGGVGGSASTGSSSAAGASSAASPGAAGVIPVGPGPRSRYTVQPQPAPGTCRYRTEGRYALPDPACTPGATNPKVTQANVATTICRGGYSSDIRPPADITGREKAANALSYGYKGSMKTGEYDHLISLSLGGDPNDPRNLWVEPNDRKGATGTNNSKDSVEDAAHAAICNGRMTLAEVQQGIATDWPALGRRLGVSLP
jgi:hypothetical protein